MMYSTIIFAEVDHNKMSVLQKHNVEFITLTDEELIAYMAEYDYISLSKDRDDFCYDFTDEDDALLEEIISDVEVSL